MWGNRHTQARRSTAVATLAIAGLGLMAGLAPAAVAHDSGDDATAESPGRPHRLQLTDEQQTCLQEHGVERPATDENGERVRPTEEQRAAFRAAAEGCGIDLPNPPPDGEAPADAPAGDGAESS